MPNIEIKHLVKSNRFPDNEVKLLLLILYLPLGLILLLLRSILVLCLVTLGQSLPDSPAVQKLINKMACLSFGINVTVENPKKRENVEAYVSNSLSVFDQLAVHTATGAVSPTSKIPLHKLPGFGSVNLGNMSDIQRLKQNIEVLLKENSAIYLTPEEKPTNGRALLKFKSEPFQLFSKVQPICLSIERPFLDISVTTLGSSYLNDALFSMFSPVTNYKLKFLPSLEKKSLSDAEFAEIVRENIATELKIEATNFTVADLAEYEKRKLAEEQLRSQSRPSIARTGFNSEIQRMTAQVKEVLPHVPLNTIYNDLCITKSVDNTITNILEGRVRFVPEQVSSSSSGTSQASTSASVSSPPTSSSTVQFNTAASSFSKSATERTKSFRERKEQLIAAARKRYIEKHNLDIPL